MQFTQALRLTPTTFDELSVGIFVYRKEDSTTKRSSELVANCERLLSAGKSLLRRLKVSGGAEFPSVALTNKDVQYDVYLYYLQIDFQGQCPEIEC